MMYCLHLMLEGYSDIYMCTCIYVYGIVPSAPRSLDANFLALILNPGSVTRYYDSSQAVYSSLIIHF